MAQHQPACDGDDGEGVDGGGDAEPEPGDDDLAAGLVHVVCHALHLGEDADDEEDPCDAVVDRQGEDHPVRSLTPERLVPEEKVTKECVEEDDENGAEDDQSCSERVFGQSLPVLVAFGCLCPPVQPARKLICAIHSFLIFALAIAVFTISKVNT